MVGKRFFLVSSENGDYIATSSMLKRDWKRMSKQGIISKKNILTWKQFREEKIRKVV
jgi:hypothetical protein